MLTIFTVMILLLKQMIQGRLFLVLAFTMLNLVRFGVNRLHRHLSDLVDAFLRRSHPSRWSGLHRIEATHFKYSAVK